MSASYHSFSEAEKERKKKKETSDKAPFLDSVLPQMLEGGQIDGRVCEFACLSHEFDVNQESRKCDHRGEQEHFLCVSTAYKQAGDSEGRSEEEKTNISLSLSSMFSPDHHFQWSGTSGNSGLIFQASAADMMQVHFAFFGLSFVLCSCDLA